MKGCMLLSVHDFNARQSGPGFWILEAVSGLRWRSPVSNQRRARLCVAPCSLLQCALSPLRALLSRPSCARVHQPQPACTLRCPGRHSAQPIIHYLK